MTFQEFLRKKGLPLHQFKPYVSLSMATLRKAYNGKKISLTSKVEIERGMKYVGLAREQSPRHVQILFEVRALARNPQVKNLIKDNCPAIKQWLFPNK